MNSRPNYNLRKLNIAPYCFSNGSTQILECSKYPISLRGALAVSEAILIHCYSDFNSSHKQTNFDDHTVFKRFNSHIKM